MRRALYAFAPMVLLVLAAAVFNTSQPQGGKAARASRPPRPVATSFRFPKPPVMEPPEDRPVEPPLSLSASDGADLALVALEVNGLLEPPLAFTELHLSFGSPRESVIEGRSPPSAAP